MDDIKSKKKKDVNLLDLIKIIVFSFLGIIIFFFPVIINKQILSPIYFLTNLIYLKYEKFVYICVIVFISLLCIKEIGKKDKNILNKIDIILKIIAIFILIIFTTQNEFVFLKEYNLFQIMKDSIFRLVILFPISSLFLHFLLDYGLLYIFDSYFSKFTKKFFRVSGKNLLIFLLFLFVDSFLGCYVVYKLYKEGKLRKNEAIISVLNFPILNFYFASYISTQLKINFIALIISYLFVFFLTNLIICRIYPIKNKKKTFLIKNKYKEKSYNKNKLKMAILLYLDNKDKKGMFKSIYIYFNEAINIASDTIPILLASFLFMDIIVANENIINIFSFCYSKILIMLKMPYYDYISKHIVLGFFNQIYSIEVLNNGIDFVSKLMIAIIISCQGISLSTNIIFIRTNMRFITYKDIFLVYLEKILIMIFILFFVYYFYLGFSA